MSRLYHALAEALLLALLALALGLLLARQAAPMAPAPLPRPAKEEAPVEALTAKDLQGKWLLIWGGGEWDMTLSAFGGYTATRGKGGSVWAGTWHVNPDSSVTVNEAWFDDDGRCGRHLPWTAVWRRDERGRLNPRHLSGKVRRADGSVGTTVEFRRPSK